MAAPQSDHPRHRWLILTLLFAVLFSYPLLEVFNRTTRILGIPLLVLYLVLAWLLFILVIYRFTRRLDDAPSAEEGEGEDEPP